MRLIPLVVLVPALTARLAVAAPAELAGFPASAKGANAANAVTLADLDGDKLPEIVLMVEPGLTVLDRKGRALAGFPVQLRQATDKGRVVFAHPAAACDLDGDGKLELLAAGSNAHLYAVQLGGVVPAGFPVKLDGAPKSAPSCVQAKGSTKKDVVVATEEGNVLLVPSTGGAAKRVANVGKGAEAGVAVADLDGDGEAELITVGGDAKLHAVSINGKPLKGFPYKMEFRASGAPAIGDIDDDGRADIVVGAQDFKIHAVSLEGKELAGFPVETKYRIYGGAALADVDRDGVLDVVVASGDSQVYAVTGAGKAIAGWPVKLDARVVTDPVVGDLDKDGKPEIAVVTQSGLLHVLSSAGKALSGFPVRIGDKGETAPAIADLDGDGVPELVAHSGELQVHAFTFKPRGSVEAALVEWPMSGHDAAHSGRFGPTPARFKNAGLTVQAPRTTDRLVVKYAFFDLDGEPEADTQIRWFLDGKHVADLDNQREVPESRTRKGQRWSYTLQEGHNFKQFGEKSALSRIARSAEVEILNTPPQAPQVTLAPQAPRTKAALEVVIAKPSSDADGDAVQYRYVWLKDGAPQKASSTQTKIDPSWTKKGEEWRVVVVPFDGESEGEPSTAFTTILNTPPGAPAIAARPAEPATDDVLDIAVTKAAPDDDGDAVTYAYRYTVNGKALHLPAGSARVAPRILRKGDVVKVEVTAVDDEAVGATAALELAVKNTPPAAPVVEIFPASPRTDDALTVGVRTLAADPDRDPVQLVHQWHVDGAPIDLPITVAPEKTKKGQKWKLTLTPTDGASPGKSVVVETVILNTPPAPPVLALDRHVFTTDEEIAPRLAVAARDADGDPVRLKYRWFRNGQPAGLPDTKTSLAAADTRKGEAWLLEVVPHDGEVDGPSARLAFTVDNSRPTRPVIALSSAAPTVREGVSVRVATASSDPDGDSIQYKYTWLRNGAAQPWPSDKAKAGPGELARGEVWRVDVRATDGQLESEVASAVLRVANHAPDAPAIELGPSPATGAMDLACKVVKEAVDPDRDALTYRTRWFLGGQPVALSPGLATLPASMTLEGQSWECEVTAFDGELSSSAVRSKALVIGNSPPGAAVVAVSPAKPKTSQDLVCELATPAADEDFEALSYRYGWRVNGKPWTEAQQAAAWKADGRAPQPNRVPPSATRRGDTWECEVIASDGQSDGPPARAVAQVDNSPPVAPRVAVKPQRPVAGQDLVCELLQPASDADQDPLQYRYAWLRDGVDQAFAPTSVNVPGRLVKAKDIWKCSVTPTDGALDGKPAISPDVVVADAPAAPVGSQNGSSSKRRRRR